MTKNRTSGRGIAFNSENRFSRTRLSNENLEFIDEQHVPNKRTKYLEVYPKTIVNKVTSPDVGMDFSANPYQGCEHGCSYCYARPTHEYWGYSAGADFENTIMVKMNAPDLLRAQLMKKSWKPKPIVLSGNTDCYQPVERKLEITRKMLEIMLEFRQPVGVITKNAMLIRDVEIYRELAKKRLVVVNISITTLEEELRRKLEPRTSSVNLKLKAIKLLASVGVPVNVMMAPIIPSLNDHEILKMAKVSKEAGARNFGGHMIRLMGANRELFAAWLQEHYSDRSERVLNQLKSLHGGELGSSEFGGRMRGKGER